MKLYINSKGYNVIPFKHGKNVLASVMWKWFPYNPGLIQIRSKNGNIPKTGYYDIQIRVGTKCRSRIKSLIKSHLQHGSQYPRLKFIRSNWNHMWNYGDGMILWSDAHNYDQTDMLCPIILNEAKLIAQTYIADNQDYFAITP